MLPRGTVYGSWKTPRIRFGGLAQQSTSTWQRCGEQTADVTCFSFYANKTMTTGEGGMATTDNADLAAHDAFDVVARTFARCVRGGTPAAAVEITALLRRAI
ncbi:MAG: DegT/DnrJ/EryC1/StrS family aminotransferase [Blastocatellia bacterium]